MTKFVDFFFDTLGKKITCLFLAIIVLFAFFSIYQQEMLYEYSNYCKENNMQIETARDIESNVQLSLRSLMQYLQSGNEVYKEDYLKGVESIQRQLGILELAVISEEVRYILPGIRYMLKAYHENCTSAIESFEKQKMEYYSYLSKGQKTNIYLESYCEQVIQQLLEESIARYYEWEGRRKYFSKLSILFVMVIVFCLVGTLFFIRIGITNPLHRLVLASRKISTGRLDVDVPYKDKKDEINILCRVFNQMVKDVQKMFDYQKEKAEAERQLLLEMQKNEKYAALLEQTRFLALQSQTNPHFMFNTLNSIKSTVMLGKTKESLSMLDAFAVFMRYNLKDAKIPVQLAEELHITREYLKIQQFRFADRIEIVIDCEDGIADKVMIPRFTLQPIAENGILHGLEKKIRDGYLRISIKRGKKNIRARIFDNGVGISEEKLSQIQKGQCIGEKRIGIGNIKERLQIFYGRDDIFHIASKENIGTLVVLRIPWEE